MPQPKRAPERLTVVEWLARVQPDPAVVADQAAKEARTPASIGDEIRRRLVASLGDGPVTKGQFGAALDRLLAATAAERGKTPDQVKAELAAFKGRAG